MKPIEIKRLKNQVKRAKVVEKELVVMVVKMAMESMSPHHYVRFCESLTHMAENRHLDFSNII